MVVYEEHILQLCEAFAGLPPGRADVLRRALNKQKRPVIEEIRGEFFSSARERKHAPEKIVEVWELVTGFSRATPFARHTAQLMVSRRINPRG